MGFLPNGTVHGPAEHVLFLLADGDDRYGAGIRAFVRTIEHIVRDLALGRIAAVTVFFNDLGRAVLALFEHFGAFIIIAFSTLDTALLVDLDVDGHMTTIGNRPTIIILVS
jgi:hypothetical protein